MSRPKRIVIALFFLAVGILQAENNARVIPIASRCYEWLDYVFLEAGKASPDKARPWTAEEFREALRRLDTDQLSSVAQSMVDCILDEISPRDTYQERIFSFRTDPVLHPEAFIRLNLGRDSAAADWDYEWIHGFEERPPFLSVPLEFLFGESVFLYTDLSFKEEPNTVESGLNSAGAYPGGVLDNRLNVIFDDPYPRLDIYFPYSAFASFAGSFWSFKLGRDKVNWGNGVSGNMMISDYSDFFDSLNVAFFGKNFKFSAVYAVMDPFYANGERQAYSAFMGHRFDIRILERAQVALSESVVFGGDQQPVLARDTNFMMVFHNWTDPDRMNSLLTLEASVNPWRNFEVYGQVAIDELATQYELERGGGSGPPIFGYLLGAKGGLPLCDGILRLCLEWALTDPMLYNRVAPPYYYNVRRYWSLTTDQFEYIVKPIGYRYGSDAMVCFLSTEYVVPGGIVAGASITLSCQGENEVGASWDPQPGAISPTGISENKAILSIHASYPLFQWLTVEGGVNYDSTSGRAHMEGGYSHDLEGYLGAKLSLP